jgi:hypothetical protein
MDTPTAPPDGVGARDAENPDIGPTEAAAAAEVLLGKAETRGPTGTEAGGKAAKGGATAAAGADNISGSCGCGAKPTAPPIAGIVPDEVEFGSIPANNHEYFLSIKLF